MSRFDSLRSVRKSLRWGHLGHFPRNHLWLKSEIATAFGLARTLGLAAFGLLSPVELSLNLFIFRGLRLGLVLGIVCCEKSEELWRIDFVFRDASACGVSGRR